MFLVKIVQIRVATDQPLDTGVVDAEQDYP